MKKELIKKMEIYQEITDKFIRSQFEELARELHDLKVSIMVLEGVLEEHMRLNNLFKQKIQNDRGY